MWKPIEMPYEEMQTHCKLDKRQVSEWNLSLNLARFGIKHHGALRDHHKHYSIMFTTEKLTAATAAEKMLIKLKEWSK